MEYTFFISESYSPENIPLERLGEYMVALAQLLGEPANVHFKAVEYGSTALKAYVEEPAAPKVKTRIRSLEVGEFNEAQKAYDKLDTMLREDNATGRLASNDNDDDIKFPGRNKPEPEIFGPLKQDGYLDGQIYRIGGKDATIHVSITSGDRDYTGLEANRALAHQLGTYFLDATLRFYGTGTWYRQGSGEWDLKKFKIDRFEVLDDESLSETVKKLRDVQGSEWSKLADPIQALLEDRHGFRGKDVN
jgi:hypothetical protein